jgi:hypothetical protein
MKRNGKEKIYGNGVMEDDGWQYKRERNEWVAVSMEGSSACLPQMITVKIGLAAPQSLRLSQTPERKSLPDKSLRRKFLPEKKLPNDESRPDQISAEKVSLGDPSPETKSPRKGISPGKSLPSKSCRRSHFNRNNFPG